MDVHSKEAQTLQQPRGTRVEIAENHRKNSGVSSASLVIRAR